MLNVINVIKLAHLLCGILVISIVMLASGGICAKLSATRNNATPHSWGPPLESHIVWCWDDKEVLSALVIQTLYTMHLIITMRIFGTCIIWLLLRLDNGTRMFRRVMLEYELQYGLSVVCDTIRE